MISTTSRVQESTSTTSSPQTKYLMGQAPVTTTTRGGQIVERDGRGQSHAQRHRHPGLLDRFRGRPVLAEMTSDLRDLRRLELHALAGFAVAAIPAFGGAGLGVGIHIAFGGFAGLAGFGLAFGLGPGLAAGLHVTLAFGAQAGAVAARAQLIEAKARIHKNGSLCDVQCTDLAMRSWHP